MDFDDRVDVDRQAKLFEEIESTQGDFSYQSTMPNNGHNRLGLGLPEADGFDGPFHVNDATLSNRSGTAVYSGSVYVERIIDTEIHWSFFSGNSNWIAQLSGDLETLDMSQYDTVQNATNVVNSWSNTSGMVFPLCDAGVLTQRRYRALRVEDFVPGIFMHTVMRELFQEIGVKLKGDLLLNPTYKQAVVVASAKSEDDIRARSCFIQKSSTQALPGDLDFYKIDWDTDNIYPYFNNGLFDMSTNAFTANVEMDVQVEITVNLSAAQLNFMVLDKNGSLNNVIPNPYFDYVVPGSSSATNSNTLNMNVHLNSGDYFAAYIRNSISGGSTINIQSATIKVTPTFIYTANATATLPKWTKQDFVSNVLRMFNCISSFEPLTRTLTIDLFDKIHGKAPVDLSEYVTVIEEDYSSFISPYGKKNTFRYQEADDEDIKRYNPSSYVKYGAGTLQVDNDFIQNTAEVISLDFTAPITYINDTFGASLERLELLDLVEHGQKENFTGVVDSSGTARFQYANANLFYSVGQLIRIESDANVQYNGDWVISAVTSTYFEVYGGTFITNSPGTFTLLRYENKGTEDAYLLLHGGSRTISTFSLFTNWLLGTSSRTTLAFSFFNILANGRSVESVFTQGLAFGKPSNPLSYQRTLLDEFWVQFHRVLNSPIKLICAATLPDHIHNAIDFRTPVTITTEKSSNTYYVNRERGYQGSEQECEIELIKLP